MRHLNGAIQQGITTRKRTKEVIFFWFFVRSSTEVMERGSVELELFVHGDGVAGRASFAVTPTRLTERPGPKLERSTVEFNLNTPYHRCYTWDASVRAPP